eukprot:3054452-Amphidinium_carterae.1
MCESDEATWSLGKTCIQGDVPAVSAHQLHQANAIRIASGLESAASCEGCVCDLCVVSLETSDAEK